MTAAKTLEDELTVYVYMGKDGRETGFVPWRKAALPVRYLRADVVEKRERALREALSGALDVIDHGVPESCGACGTPNATCDGDCVAAAYLASDQRKWRALAVADEGEAKPNE